MSEVKYSGGSPGGLWLLTIVFIVLKLCGTITWSWWWVLAPLWLGIPVTLLFYLLVVLIVFIFVNK